MKLIVIDTETSALPEDGGTMLELAWYAVANIRDQWVPISSNEMYIQYNGPIDPCAQAVHHIKPECLTAVRGAVPREQAVHDLMMDIEPDSFLVAHNSSFDSQFLPELTNQWICTLRIAKRIWPEAPGFGNQVLRYWLDLKPDLSIANGIKPRFPHQALYDVATTTVILQKMLTVHSPAELYKMCWIPLRLKTIGFGKHKGTRFEDIPLDYLWWLRAQQNLDDNVRYTIDCVLERK
jgi:exodeoxyribonuclease X